ncbi:Autophagy-related protein 2 [Saitozyma sp. JCM 24511]|nr:Autophagy-related protein 2 [Saitozyma sp. JCM 24511]
MWSVPSFLSWPFSLPSLPSISLPANIQRRFLSYVLQRTLGRYVRAGGLDVERIQAQISEGWVEIEGLEVNTEEINSLIPGSVPLTLTSGALSKVTARVPFPNLLSDPLSLTLETLTLDFTLSPLSTKGKSPDSRSRTSSAPLLSPGIDLAGSVTSAADDFLHEELDAYEEAELDRSIRQSLVLSQTDPFSNDDLPGAFPFPSQSQSAGPNSNYSPASHAVESTTVLAGLVERILARLQFKVKDIRIRIRFDDKSHGGVFELRIAEVRYADESESSEDPALRQTIRAVRISSVSIYMLDLPSPSPTSSPARPPFHSTSSRSSSVSSTTTSTSTSSVSSSGSSTTDPQAEMYMSLAVADLRQSVADTVASGASVYQSALSERVIEEEPEGRDGLLSSDNRSNSTGSPRTSIRGRSRSRSATPTGHPRPPNEVLLLTFGSEDIVMRLKTTRPSGPSAAASQSPPIDPHPSQSPSRSTSRPNTSSQLPALDIEWSMGTIAALISPDQAATILCALQAATRPSSETSPGSPTPDSAGPVVQPRLDARVRVKAIIVALVYDMRATDSSGFATAAAQFWAKPGATYIPFGHLKLRLEGLDCGYSSKGYVPRPSSTGRPKSHSMSTSTRRTSNAAHFGPRPPVMTLTLSEMSIFEYLASDPPSEGMTDDTPPGGAFPVLIFDANLPRQYDVAPGAQSPLGLGLGVRLSSHSAPASKIVPPPTFPEFDTVDWRNSGLQKKSGVGDKAWKVRPKGRGVLKGGTHFAGEAEEGPVISVPAIVQTQPVHIFVDLSLVERLLPMLRSIAPAIRHPPVERDTPLGLRPTLPTPGSGLPRVQSSHYVIEDLDAQASSLSTVQAVQGPSEILILRCPVVRLDIRCPAPPNRRSTWGDGGHLRSGIVTLDIHGLAARIGQPRTADLTQSLPTRRASQIAPPSDQAGALQAEWQKMVFFFCRVPEKRSSAFLVIGPLAPEEGEEDMSPLLPFVEIKTVATPAQSKMQVLTARIPSVQAKIRQPTIEGLQFFADDITHWLDGAFGDGSAPKPRDDLKMIGSRFFGSKASSSASSSAIDDDDEEDDMAATRLRVSISESDIALHVPREDGGERVLSLRASDVDAKVESNVTGRQETAFNIVVMDADFFDRSDPASPTRILGRTTPLTLTAHNSPVVSLRFSSLTDIATGTKETGIKLTSTSWTFFLTQDLAWVQELKAFAKTPEGVFEDVVPSEITRIALNLYDCSVHISAPTVGGALVLVLGSMEVRTDLVSDAEENTVEMGLAGGYVLAVDDRAAVGTLQSGYQLSVEAWRGLVADQGKRAGYASLLEIEAFDMQVFRDLSGSHVVVVDILQVMGKVTACADSMATLGVLVGDIAKLAPAKPPADEPERSPAMLEHSINVFSSVDEEAFKRIPDIVSGADMIEDDLPTNLDYLDAATRHLAAALTMDRSTGETLRTWQTEGDRGDLDRFAGEVNGETIKILYNLPFDVEENYWDTLPVIRNGLGDDTKLGKLRVRVHDCNIGIFLHDGYDWARTRKAIEDEIKAVRKRLEKIRQLLASGQKADESIEKTGTSSVLFNSVYIGLDQSRENLDSAALIAAIDEELEDLGGAETASQSSWQSFPTARGGAGPGAGSSRSITKTRLKGRRLARSKRPQIEIALRGVRAEVDVFGQEDQVASRVNARVKSLEILDHIKTSTWKKFLTEMKADSRGNIRETDADMVRVELVAVRPSLPNTDEEYRLKAKMLPLRLHVDQDALDFLKRFGSFQPPAPAPGSSAPSQPEPQPRTSSGKEPFFQHVEIYPVEIKLDYKPKRVDFAALREGKTIELMNFFHFDGAEMTLRHITMSGVSGWSRLSTMLQDIWTPDVKANQLADVISGVSPIRSMVNVGSGVADLILLPIEQYRKDGRLARGVQRGTNSFVRSTAMEMMKLGARLATGTQVILERAEGVLGGGTKFADGLVAEVEPSVMERNELERGLDGEEGSEDEGLGELVSRYANQPSGAVEGVQEAYRSLSKNINSAAQTILAVPMEVYERSGGDGPLKAVVRAVPIAVLKPMIGASEAVSKTLLGVRNSLDPQARRELGDKYK